MATVLKGGAVFLHIPKTGGNWVSRVLEEQGLVERHLPIHKHADAFRALYWNRFGTGQTVLRSVVAPQFLRKCRRLIGLRNDDTMGSGRPFMFCFVRHPLSWYESWWRYMTQHKWYECGSTTDPYQWHPNSILNGLGEDDFNRFVRNVIRKRPGYVTELFGWYTPPFIDYIGKQENLTEDLVRVLHLLKLSFNEKEIRTAPRVNVSRSSSEIREKVEWEPDLMSEVSRLEHTGILRYGYEPSFPK